MTGSIRKPAIGPSVWHVADLGQDESWIYRLSADDILELESALHELPAELDDLRAVTRATFPLPALSAKLAGLQREVIEGRGFVLLKGLPLERYSRHEAATLYWAIGQ